MLMSVRHSSNYGAKRNNLPGTIQEPLQSVVPRQGVEEQREAHDGGHPRGPQHEPSSRQPVIVEVHPHPVLAEEAAAHPVGDRLDELGLRLQYHTEYCG
jgi:hypothetical protein